MSTYDEKALKERLGGAVKDLMPDPKAEAERLWAIPAEKAEEDAWYLEGTSSERKIRTAASAVIKWSAAAAAFFIIAAAGWLGFFRLTDAVVYLDVNPGVSMDLNRAGRVLRAGAENEDGLIIMDGMDLRGTEVNVAMNALLGSMVKHGYLSEAKNVILVSVDGRNAQRTEALRSGLLREAERAVSGLVGSATVLGQSVEADEEIRELSQSRGISPGKALLVQKISGEDPDLDEDELASMTMSEIYEKIEDEGIDPGSLGLSVMGVTGRTEDHSGEEPIKPDDRDDDDGDDDDDDDDDDKDDDDHRKDGLISPQPQNDEGHASVKIDADPDDPDDVRESGPDDDDDGDDDDGYDDDVKDP